MQPALDAFNQCPSFKQVDVYVSDGLEEAVRGLNGSTSLTVTGTTLEVEQRGIDVINRLIDQSRDRMDRLPGCHRLPHFRLIGLGALAPLLNALLRAGPEFVHRLAGPGGRFTYDCPKVVEALLRMGLWLRGDTTPLFRFDADVEVNEGAVRKLIAQYDAVSKAGNPYFLFSGGYCGAGNDDFINRHAVRTHWLENAYHARLFLRDIGEIGPSPGAQLGALQLGRGRFDPHPWRQVGERCLAPSHLRRRVGQVGTLLASPAPFMNASHMYVWVDDYFPRLLHEQIGDIPHAAVQHVTGPEVRQDRHPSGIGEGDISWAQKFYFERLLRRALLLSTVADARGQSGPLADAVKRALDCELRVLNAHDEAVIHPKFWQAASEQLADVVAPLGQRGIRQRYPAQLGPAAPRHGLQGPHLHGHRE